MITQQVCLVITFRLFNKMEWPSGQTQSASVLSSSSSSSSSSSPSPTYSCPIVTVALDIITTSIILFYQRRRRRHHYHHHRLHHHHNRCHHRHHHRFFPRHQFHIFIICLVTQNRCNCDTFLPVWMSFSSLSAYRKSDQPEQNILKKPFSSASFVGFVAANGQVVILLISDQWKLLLFR